MKNAFSVYYSLSSQLTDNFKVKSKYMLVYMYKLLNKNHFYKLHKMLKNVKSVT